MKEMIAFCGLDCNKCGAFLATQDNDDQKRAEVTQEWSRLFKVEIKHEDMNYDDCPSDGGCLFDFIFNNAPDAKNRLDEINSSLKG